MRLGVRCGVSSPHRAPDRPVALRPVRERPEPRDRRRGRVLAAGAACGPTVLAPPAPAPAPRNPPPWVCRAPCPAGAIGAGACASGARRGGGGPDAALPRRAERCPRAGASCQCVPRQCRRQCTGTTLLPSRATASTALLDPWSSRELAKTGQIRAQRSMRGGCYKSEGSGRAGHSLSHKLAC